MTRLHRRLAAALLVLNATAPAISRADDAPLQLDLNQTWTYRQEATGDGPVESIPRVEVATAYPRAGNWAVAIRSVGTARAANAPTEAAQILGLVDGHGCIVDVLEAQTLQNAPCAPAAPHDAWTIALPDGRTREFKAIARENIRVPAGSFEALRIESVESAVMALSGGVRSSVATSRTVYWYAPRAGAMARVEHEILRPDGTVAMRQVHVLDSFGPASEESRLAVQATSGWQAYARAKAAHEKIEAIMAATPPLRQKARILVSSMCRPEYPAAALRAHATGQTRVRFVVDADGTPRDSEIIGASGSTREHLLLDNAARAVLARCPFAPAVSDAGAPVSSAIEISYSWRID